MSKYVDKNPPPPKLLRPSALPIPVLKIERLIPDKNGDYNSKLVEACIEADAMLDSLSPPPKLDKEDDNDSISVASSSTRGNNSDAHEVGILPDKKRKISNDPKRIIQAIFAKPKKGKAKKRKTPKPKKTAKQAVTTQSKYLRIKIRPASSRRRQQEDSDNGDDMEVDEVDDNKSIDGSTKALKNSKRTKDEEEADDDSEEEFEEDEEKSQDDNDEEPDSRRTNKREDNKKYNEDEDVLDDSQEWKPVRAAMVAAMELVAKKQVTDDMRVDRRVRKHVVKPLPPKGRGRRTIFKKLNKPVKSCDDTAGPFVSSTFYYDNTCFQKGDIVYLISDMRGKVVPNLEYHRFFQVNGFLRIPVGDNCASLTQLRRVVPLPEPPYNPLFVLPRDMKSEEEKAKEREEEEWPYPFKLIEYMPVDSTEYMVPISNIKFVMRAPPDFYFGHDILFHEPFGRRVYARLGNDLVGYKETNIHDESENESENQEKDIDEQIGNVHDEKIPIELNDQEIIEKDEVVAEKNLAQGANEDDNMSSSNSNISDNSTHSQNSNNNRL